MPDPNPDPAVAPLLPGPRRDAVAGVTRSHRRLVDELDELTDDDVRRPSNLPGWNVGHVLTHIARNADSFRGIAEGVLAGEVRDQYPGGAEQRTGDIEAGAGRRAAALAADVRDAADGLERAWAQLSDDHWTTGEGRTIGWGVVPVSYLVLARWREVEIHRTDLGLGATWQDLDPAYVRLELPRSLSLLAGAAAVDPGAADTPGLDHVLVATLFGRRSGPVDLPTVL